MARGGREGAAPKDDERDAEFPTERHRRAASQELRTLEAYFKLNSSLLDQGLPRGGNFRAQTENAQA